MRRATLLLRFSASIASLTCDALLMDTATFILDDSLYTTASLAHDLATFSLSCVFWTYDSFVVCVGGDCRWRRVFPVGHVADACVLLPDAAAKHVVRTLRSIQTCKRRHRTPALEAILNPRPVASVSRRTRGGDCALWRWRVLSAIGQGRAAARPPERDAFSRVHVVRCSSVLIPSRVN